MPQVFITATTNGQVLLPAIEDRAYVIWSFTLQSVDTTVTVQFVTTDGVPVALSAPWVFAAREGCVVTNARVVTRLGVGVAIAISPNASVNVALDYSVSR
jgi:hypothetical protein